MLCDGRHGLRLRRPVRQARARRHADRNRLGDLDRRARVRASPRPQRWRLEILRRLPAEAAAEEGRAAARPRPRTSRPLPSRLYIECTAACNISCAQACCAPGDRHHPHAAGRHARLRAVPARDRRSRPVARPGRLLQLRRSVPAQARDRDVRVHQGRASRTSISTPARTAWPSPRSRRAGSSARASTRSRSRSTAPPPESYAPVPASAATSTRRSAI